MPPRIAIPTPHSTDRDYAERAYPQYDLAVRLAGGDAVRIPLDHAPAEVTDLIESCDGVLLPGSKADVDPARFQQTKAAQTAAADPCREQIDNLLLEHAYARRKPVLGICYGLQSLNVFRSGSLIQHVPDFLPETTRGKVNHAAGKNVVIAHTVKIDRNSLLAQVVDERSPGSEVEGSLVVPVNSSHHQSADAIGNGLRVVARCAEDGLTEALEGTSPDHFVVAVQWHPERSVDEDETSRRIFFGFIEATKR